MIRYIYGEDLHKFPKLARSMFLDRADQFKTRLGWAVNVDDRGFERDEYDDENPLYVIWENADGTHGGSMRLLPTIGKTMVNDHFIHLTDGVRIQSPLIWECTRFCLSRTATPGVAAALMLAGGEVMQEFGVEHYVGVFDARMVRIYRRIGSSPEVLGSEGEGREKISVGLWEFTSEAQASVSKSAGITPEMSKRWFELSFGTVVDLEGQIAA
ncbi:acyl-homoserine-lactone synthase [Tropicibacter naphthalenivorans]|uniref:Acyl-homoserine-lactone synthase n=1 Tax=Tropicibacter naphthalenivorans TaxID=441103 RepID=A0A0P1G8K9_9RHOB|nr:acyl-homoserine-lactone synthase [Tropicibacter naphthalenivorans]CUH77946.1 Isovaleryl-homoserine lactone synthase [Tropicibacter naphthalenivorans]SMC94972.1 N-acyl-L-homoserine lactone synthetase [Tropicibacter naphthalenivorans]